MIPVKPIWLPVQVGQPSFLDSFKALTDLEIKIVLKCKNVQPQPSEQFQEPGLVEEDAQNWAKQRLERCLEQLDFAIKARNNLLRITVSKH